MDKVDKVKTSKKATRKKMDLSIVIPVYNEDESIGKLYTALNRVLPGLGINYEVILIDDGSTDSTYEVLKKIHKKDNRFKIIRFRRNFGQTAAMSAGFHYSSGDVIITLDADLQNDPEDIPAILEKLDEGYDIVSGWRKDRKDKAVTRRLPSIIANKIISELTGVHLHDYGCTLKAYRKEIIDNIDLYGEMHRYIPAVASRIGAKVIRDTGHSPRQKIRKVQIRHIPDHKGRTGYNNHKIPFKLLPEAHTDLRPPGIILGNSGNYYNSISYSDEGLFLTEPCRQASFYTVHLYDLYRGPAYNDGAPGRDKYEDIS